MNTDDTNDLHPAKFQEHCQFSCATNGIAELANDEFIATFEGYLSDDSTTFKALEARFTPNLEQDFNRFKKEVKKTMATEIVKRYYYQRGELQESLKGDAVLEKALQVLADPELMKKTLSKPE